VGEIWRWNLPGSAVNGSISLQNRNRGFTTLGPGRIVAVVEEVEERLPATYPSEPVKITDLLKEEVVRKSGPRFIVMVPFYEQQR
jgi:hypothetical protein